MNRLQKEKWDKLFPLVLGLMFIAGVTVGSLISRFSPDGYVLSYDKNTALKFTDSFLNFFKPCFIIWLFGFTKISVYVSSAVLAYRGGLLGYFISLGIKSFGLKSGFLTIISSTLPQNLIFIPFLLFLSLASAGQGKRALLILFLFILAVCALSALIDCYITGFLIELTLRR